MSQRRMSMRLNPNPIGARRAKGIRAEAIEPERRRANNIGTDVDEAGDSNSSESSESNRDQNAIILAKKKGQDKTQIRQNTELKDRSRLKVIGDNAFEVKPYCTGLVSTITHCDTKY
jgi:hypothetical protein